MTIAERTTNDIADKMKNARIKSGKTQQEVADAVGIKQNTLANYEAGVRVPRDSTKQKLADYYGISVQELFFAQ